MLGIPILWILLFFVVAFLYSAVGHGGASGYLALMSIWHLAPEHMKPVALILNLVVSGIAFIQFYRQGHFLWRLFLPIAALSIPMAYLGGFTPLKDDVYQLGLGVFLVISVVLLNVNLRGRISLKKDYDKRVLADNASGFSTEYLLAAAVMGGGIGYVSGLLGIGGCCGEAAAFELRAGTVLVAGRVGPRPGMGMRRGSLIALSAMPQPPPTFSRGAAWSPSILPLLAGRLARAGFRATAGRPADAFGGVWQQWHGDLLTGGRGEIFHRLCP